MTSAPGTTFSVNNGGGSIDEAPAGLSKIEVAQGGPAVDTLAGKVNAASAGTGTQVVLNTGQTEIRHLVGQAYGTMVANSANNVTIDTTTTINIDLSNMPPLSIGSTWFRVEGLAVDAAMRLGR